MRGLGVATVVACNTIRVLSRFRVMIAFDELIALRFRARRILVAASG